MNQKRIEKLQQKLREQKLEAMALMPGPNMLYVSGIHAHASERPILLLILAEGEPAIIIPTLEAPKAKKAGISAERIFNWGDDEGFAGAFQKACRMLSLAGKTVAVETLYMRVLELEMLQEAAPGLKTEHADGIMNGLRLVKDEDEIAKMRKAVEVAETAMHKLLPQIKIGMTEKQIAGILSQELMNAGSDKSPFGPIVSSGPNAASPHAVPTDRPIGAGELMIIDWGAIVNDYPSDITRTFAVGEVSDEYKQIYETVKQANEAGKAISKPANRCSQVDEAAREVIDEAGYGEYFIHRTGHGLGLEVHEEPSMMTGVQDQLVEGMTYTVEPGIYVPDQVGVRIEDDVVITADGCESLTSFPRELMQVG